MVSVMSLCRDVVLESSAADAAHFKTGIDDRCGCDLEERKYVDGALAIIFELIVCMNVLCFIDKLA